MGLVGARQHYAVPRMFALGGALEKLYTDFWTPRWAAGILRHGPAPLRRIAGRRHDAIPAHRVMALDPLRFLASQWMLRRRFASTESLYDAYLRTGAVFGRWTKLRMARRPLDPGRTAFFGFSSTCLEALEHLRKRGVPTVVDQIDPARVESDLVAEELSAWNGWEDGSGQPSRSYLERIEKEWSAASVVLVNSTWSRDALISQGVSPDKIIVVPIAYEPGRGDRADEPRRENRSRPLRVLWLGQVNLRKGFPYLVEAARRLPGVTFDVVGPVRVSEKARRECPPNLLLRGNLPRIEVDRAYREADLFVLPTISDGFAITQLEAMAAGLPVIATPNCGEVVTDGVDGLMVPPRDGDALAQAISRLDEDRSLLASMQEAARRKVACFSLSAVQDRLMQELGRMPAFALRAVACCSTAITALE